MNNVENIMFKTNTIIFFYVLYGERCTFSSIKLHVSAKQNFPQSVSENNREQKCISNDLFVSFQERNIYYCNNNYMQKMMHSV
jgi:hypothetical protein